MKRGKRLHAIVKGRVQGIFFRANTEKAALKLGLKGFVRNTPDGNVEVVAEGAKENLEELLKWCAKGPMLAHVESVDSKWMDATGEFETFSIRY
jgi:acylphosphatase